MDAFFLAQQYTDIAIAILIIVGNVFVLHIIRRHKTLHHVTNYLIASLACADMLVGIIAIPVTLVINYGIPHHFYDCLFMNCVIIILTQISIFNLMAIAIERFFGTLYLLFHRTHFTPRLTAIFAVVSWVAGTLVGFVPMFGWHLPKPQNVSGWTCSFVYTIDFSYMIYYNILGFVWTPMVLMFILYAYIFCIVHKHLSQQRDLKAGSADDTYKWKQLKKELKSAHKIFLILLAFAASWIPLHTINCLIFCAHVYPDRVVILVTILLTHFNSAVNPLLYIYSSKKFQMALKSTLRLSCDHSKNAENSLGDASSMNDISMTDISTATDTTGNRY